jgi:hypothetical protein
VKAHTIPGLQGHRLGVVGRRQRVAKFQLDLDGWDEATATALASASYVSAAEFNFSQATAFSIGGTIGGANPLTYTGGTAVSSIVKSISLKGDNALATERFGLGNAGGEEGAARERHPGHHRHPGGRVPPVGVVHPVQGEHGRPP